MGWPSPAGGPGLIRGRQELVGGETADFSSVSGREVGIDFRRHSGATALVCRNERNHIEGLPHALLNISEFVIDVGGYGNFAGNVQIIPDQTDIHSFVRPLGPTFDPPPPPSPAPPVVG